MRRFDKSILEVKDTIVNLLSKAANIFPGAANLGGKTQSKKALNNLKDIAKLYPNGEDLTQIKEKGAP